LVLLNIFIKNQDSGINNRQNRFEAKTLLPLLVSGISTSLKCMPHQSAGGVLAFKAQNLFTYFVVFTNKEN
jgi:hypothetical protein